MKKTVITFVIFLMTISFVMAQQTNMVVNKKDGTSVKIAVSEIESITWESISGQDTKVHEYVDLGLPSGTLWATCNVGATTPEDYGDYFAWGATSPQTIYNWENTPYQTQNTTDDKSTKFTKYLGTNNESKHKDKNATDSDALKTVLDLEDDAAHVNWGGSWRMPTKEEQDELRDTDNCTWRWTTQNGVNGYKVTSKTNGNSLFLPAAGCREGSYPYGDGTYGLYWSSSLRQSISAYFLYFYSGSVAWDNTLRFYGLSVRPVCK